MGISAATADPVNAAIAVKATKGKATKGFFMLRSGKVWPFLGENLHGFSPHTVTSTLQFMTIGQPECLFRKKADLRDHFCDNPETIAHFSTCCAVEVSRAISAAHVSELPGERRMTPLCWGRRAFHCLDPLLRATNHISASHPRSGG